nr:hypothetical protein BaRGS_019844 [Batillaria attramentaria]
MERVKYTDAGGDTIRYLRFPDGLNLPSFHDDMDFEAIASFPLRDDDVLICSYPRTGCHWTWEITRMLQTGRTDFEDAADKEDQMLEFKFHGELDHVPSPRILSSHFHFRYLPRDVLRKRIKILFIYLDYGAYSDYLLDWEREIAKHPDLPVHVLSYEALHRTPATDELAKLSSFLGKNYTASFLKSVADACSFQRIVKRKGQKWANSRAEIHGNLGDSDIEESFMYRKGKVGDWKNWFSVAESEEFDRHWSKAMMGSKFA